jgi:hypothetical protein
MKREEVKWRLVLPLQTKGDLGKSSETEAFCCYLEHRGIEWRGFDLDPDNRSFSSRFAKQVVLSEPGREPADAIISVLRRSGESKVTRWDVRAHLSDAILNALRLTHFPEQAAERGGRLTVVFFPQDNVEVMSDMDGIAESLGESVDYLIVKNRFKSAENRMYDASQLQKDLLALGAGEMEMPVLLNTAKNPLAKLSLTQGRNVTVGEAARNGELALDFTARLVIEDWLNKMYAAYDRNARILLPAAEAARVAPPAESEPGPKARRSTKRINISNL